MLQNKMIVIKVISKVIQKFLRTFEIASIVRKFVKILPEGFIFHRNQDNVFIIIYHQFLLNTNADLKKLAFGNIL